MRALRKCWEGNNVRLGWIWARDGITVSEWESVRTPKLPIALADIFLLRDHYVRTLKATFGMYHDPAELPAIVNYEKHVTAEVATQSSNPRSKFAT